ncbi:MAG TPA: YqzK family protein [Bacillus sp. (in: firmicutes)]|uniref:YqzK family protein n=1 Tax=Bacillus litorisediminis TaxID=2922713 RepID=UPI001FAC3A90|nr:YqzK family protein [Bacillus litorisediminis]HWO75793.1 YqzK family protein [Bacillus sp. (in: firmicutes)]
MKKWIRLVLNTLKVFLLFTLCTILFYYGMIWVHQEYQNYQKYDEPDGAAVKVFETKDDPVMLSGYERIIYFFLHGE